MTLKRMDNVLIVVDDLEAAKAFFIELGLKLEGETTVEGPLVSRLIGLNDVRATLTMMRTPDGQGIELDKFHTPNAIRFGPVDAPVNTLGLRRIMFAVDDLDAVVRPRATRRRLKFQQLSVAPTTLSFALVRLCRHREVFLKPRFPERCLVGDGLGRLSAVKVESQRDHALAAEVEGAKGGDA